MDLGKMLAEALNTSITGGQEYASLGNPNEAVIDAELNLNAAAEAFLAKVREAEDAEEDRRKDARQMAEAQRHEAGPVMSYEEAVYYAGLTPYYGEVE